MCERVIMSEAYQETNVSTFRLRRRTPGSFLLVPCPKQDRAIRCQGQLEGAAATILAACPQVARIREQPCSVWYSWDTDKQGLQIDLLDRIPQRRPRNTELSGTSHIVPDFLVELTDGRSMRANIALLRNNSHIAATIAVALAGQVSARILDQRSSDYLTNRLPD